MTNQSRVTAWVREVFTEKEANDAQERSLRTAEEALELAQACDVDAATLHRLVDYVFSRPVGAPGSEIAGTMVTVYALAAALGVDAQTAFEAELLRIQHPEVIARCRRRQHEKRAALAPLEVRSNDGEGTWFELRKEEREPTPPGAVWIGETCPPPDLLAEALAAPREPTPFERAKKPAPRER